MNIRLKKLPKNDRPRERLVNKGPSSLSDAELISIILKTGTKEMSVSVLANYLLQEFNGLNQLKKVTYRQLYNIRGIGQAKACQILAALELAKRINVKQGTIIDVRITSPSIVYEYYKNIVDPFQEGFYCIYLDSSKKVLKEMSKLKMLLGWITSFV